MSTPKLRFSLGFNIFPYKTPDYIRIKCMMSIHNYNFVGFLAQCNFGYLYRFMQ